MAVQRTKKEGPSISYFAPLDEGPRVVGPDVLARPLFGPFSRRHPKSHVSKKICG